MLDVYVPNLLRMKRFHEALAALHQKSDNHIEGSSIERYSQVA